MTECSKIDIRYSKESDSVKGHKNSHAFIYKGKKMY